MRNFVHKTGALSIVLCLMLSLSLFTAKVVQAAEDTGEEPIIKTEVVLPSTPEVVVGAEGFFQGQVRNVADYISTLYEWLISVVGVLAAVMIMFAGFQWLTAGGNQERIQKAKGRLFNALLGLMVAFLSYTLLSTISPGLVDLKIPDLDTVGREVLQSFPWCEDMKGIHGIEIVPTVSGQKDCGDMALMKITTGSSGNDEDEDMGEQGSYCIYRGNCGMLAFSSGRKHRRACMQWNMTPEELKDFVQRKEKAATCVLCMDLTVRRVRKMGYRTINDDICNLWEESANHGPLSRATKLERRGMARLEPGVPPLLMSYCGYSSGKRACVQSDIDCADSKIDSCASYDTAAKLWYHTDGDTNDPPTTYQADTLESFGVHLFAVCQADPCATSPAGCEGKSPIYTLQKLLRDGGIGIDDCGRADQGGVIYAAE